MSAAPPISVVVSTRDRAEMAAGCIASILRIQDAEFELVVVDQSEDSSTESALDDFRSDPRMIYLRGRPEGLSAGRNLGISRACGKLIACTDDDCRVPPDWLRGLAGALRQDDRTAVVFGNVVAISCDRASGFVPAWKPDKSSLARSLREQHLSDGMGACMGLKRSAWERLGGFDEMLGAGAPFQAAEELDFSVRALQAGFWVRTTPEAAVSHHGFRSWKEGDRLIKCYLFGIGAMTVKHLKCGRWGILHYLLQLSWRWAFTGPTVDLGRTPSRWLRLVAFSMGMSAGLAHPVERRRALYRSGSVTCDTNPEGGARHGRTLQT